MAKKLSEDKEQILNQIKSITSDLIRDFNLSEKSGVALETIQGFLPDYPDYL